MPDISISIKIGSDTEISSSGVSPENLLTDSNDTILLDSNNVQLLDSS